MIRALRFLKQVVNPLTVIASKRKHKGFFNSVDRNLQKYENIYRKGGLISQAIDAYPLFGLSAGYELEGDEGKVALIENWFHKINIDELMWQAWVDALVYGDCIEENVMSRGKDVLYVVPRNPKFFNINLDEYGMVTGYTQHTDGSETVLTPQKVTSLALITVSGESHGISLIQRAFDDIMRDTRTAESTAIAIERHGYPRFHIKAGSEENHYDDESKKQIAREFEELKADNEFITDYDLDIVAIDTQGVAKIATYNEWSLGRLLGALGVPSEVIGTGQNVSTYATASVEMVSFILRVETQQKKVARCFNELIDLKLREPGAVKIIFNPINKEGLSNTNNNKNSEVK